MEFRELIDGDFMMIMNGNKLQERVDSGTFSIDLNSGITGVKLSPLSVIQSRRIKNTLRGKLTEVIRKEILDLKNDSKRINSFVKKYGFDAIEVPAVRKYFRGLVKKAREKNSEEIDECKMKLRRFIVAISHTDKKVQIVRDISIPALVGSFEKIEGKANRFYPSVIDFCRDCGGKKSSYSQCDGRVGCESLRDHVMKHLTDLNQVEIKKCLTFNTPSEYIAESFRVKMGVDRPRAEALLRYAKQMRDLS